MIQENSLDAVLVRMIELLRAGEFYGWANALEKISTNFSGDSREKLSELMSMYGGMGSINDIVFCKDGSPLVEENNEFNALRMRLFEICISSC